MDGLLLVAVLLTYLVLHFGFKYVLVNYCGFKTRMWRDSDY